MEALVTSSPYPCDHLPVGYFAFGRKGRSASTARCVRHAAEGRLDRP